VKFFFFQTKQSKKNYNLHGKTRQKLDIRKLCRITWAVWVAEWINARECEHVVSNLKYIYIFRTNSFWDVDSTVQRLYPLVSFWIHCLPKDVLIHLVAITTSQLLGLTHVSSYPMETRRFRSPDMSSTPLHKLVGTSPLYSVSYRRRKAWSFALVCLFLYSRSCFFFKSLMYTRSRCPFRAYRTTFLITKSPLRSIGLIISTQQLTRAETKPYCRFFTRGGQGGSR
jgi:hypothetical protein